MKNVITAAAVGKIVIAKNQYHDDEKQENLVSLWKITSPTNIQLETTVQQKIPKGPQTQVTVKWRLKIR